MTGFNDRVLGWLRQWRYPGAVSVEKVLPYGTDWAGDTESGFYDEFNVTIEFTEQMTVHVGPEERTEFIPRTVEVNGENMASLWQWVVAGYEEQA